jgi:hypothetical protein
VPGERLLRILGLLHADSEAVPTTARLCGLSVELAAASGAGIMLMSGETLRGSLCTTDSVSATIEELQFTLGEGPCLDAYGQRRPVIEPDLGAPAVPRWPAFTPAAIEAGARAVFGFPLLLGATRLGALNVYRDAPGPLSDEQHADLSVMADVSARAVIDMQAHARSGSVATEIEAGSDFRLVVHQASGMVSAQLDTDVVEALVRLRAHAFVHNRPLAEVAVQVVNRQLRFDDPTAGENKG